MDTFELTQRLAVALAIGLVIGMERGWKQREEAEGERAAGLRTHALSGLLGGIWGALALNTGQAGVIALALAFAAFTAAIAVFRYREMVHDKTFGATTVVAAMLAFALGALAVTGDRTAAAAAGVATAMLLALKAALHEWVKRLTWEELRAGLILLAMTVILLPLLPNRELAPSFPVNPHDIWLLTILIAALSFAGYVAIRLAGPSIGVLLSGLAGGLVSSTAVTLNVARLARADGERCNIFAAGVLVASAVMILRVLVIVGIVNIALLKPIAAPLLLGALTLAGIAGYLANWGHEDCPVGKPLALQNPFELRVVLEFGALLAVIMAAAKLLSGRIERRDRARRHLGLRRRRRNQHLARAARPSRACARERGHGHSRRGGGEQPHQDRPRHHSGRLQVRQGRGAQHRRIARRRRACALAGAADVKMPTRLEPRRLRRPGRHSLRSDMM